MKAIPEPPVGGLGFAYKGAENTTTFAASNTIVVSLPTLYALPAGQAASIVPAPVLSINVE